MTIVDTHCHAGLSWFEPIEMLLTQMNANDVDKAVLIQHGGTYDNSYLFECSRRFEGRFAVVVIVDEPVSIVPNPEVIEPEFNAPVVTILPPPTLCDEK